MAMLSITRIKLSGFLTYKTSSEWFDLDRCNVIIGPNASGKSNLFTGLRLLRSAFSNLLPFVIKQGGFSSLVSGYSQMRRITLSIQAFTDPPYNDLRYTLSLEQDLFDRSRFVFGELAELVDFSEESTIPQVVYEKKAQSRKFRYNNNPTSDETQHELIESEINSEDPSEIKSIIESHLSHLGDFLTQLPVFVKKMWFNLDSFHEALPIIRQPQSSEQPRGFPAEDWSNLGVVLNALHGQLDVWQKIIEYVQRGIPWVKDLHIEFISRNAEIYFIEDNLLRKVPAVRISDGSLRYLCLVVLLIHPNPPPVICLEEPEVGLHPDLIHILAELILKASERTQIIVTTHSDLLVSAIGQQQPGAVIICERDDEGTKLKRLDPGPLKEWLEEYTLGELWLKNQLGGTRW